MGRVKTFKHSLHKSLWQFIHENPTSGKIDWPGWKTSKDVTGNRCFACDYAGGSRECQNCPLDWPEGTVCGKGNYWDEWHDARGGENWGLVAELAAQIRDLPVKKGVKCI